MQEMMYEIRKKKMKLKEEKLRKKWQKQPLRVNTQNVNNIKILKWFKKNIINKSL